MWSRSPGIHWKFWSILLIQSTAINVAHSPNKMPQKNIPINVHSSQLTNTRKGFLTSSSESLEVEGSANSSETNFTAEETTEDQAGCCCWAAGCTAMAAAGEAAEEALPTIRASSLAILVGKDWSDWLEELEEKCRSMSSDMFASGSVCQCSEPRSW